MKDKIITIICSGTFGTIAGAIITHILYGSKLRKEQKIKIIGYISKQRIDCINNIQKTLNKLKRYERADIVHPDAEIDGQNLYPCVFSNFENFEEFYNDYQYLIDNYSDFLNMKCLRSLYIGMNYIKELLLVSHIGFSNENLYVLGIELYPEINKWLMKFKDNLNLLLNNPPLKYQKRTGIIYFLNLILITHKVKHTVLYKQFVKNTELENDNLGDLFNEQEIELDKELSLK